MRRADISRKIYPAVNLALAVFPSLPARSFVNGLHQRPRCQFSRIANDRTSADLPIAGGKRRRIEPRPWNAAWGFGVWIGLGVWRRGPTVHKLIFHAFQQR